MAGNVAALEAALDNAFNVPHGGDSQRSTIASNLAQAIADYIDSITFSVPTCNAGGVHPPVERA